MYKFHGLSAVVPFGLPEEGPGLRIFYLLSVVVFGDDFQMWGFDEQCRDGRGAPTTIVSADFFDNVYSRLIWMIVLCLLLTNRRARGLMRRVYELYC